MFGFFKHTVGVSTVRKYLHEIPIPPLWVTAGPGGDGFVEIADAVIAARAARQYTPEQATRSDCHSHSQSLQRCRVRSWSSVLTRA